MTPCDTLESYITQRSSHITRDCHTFLWVRTEHTTKFDLQETKGAIGGGNMLILLGLLCVLSYLGKIHYILEGNDPFSKEQAKIARKTWGGLPPNIKSLLKPKMAHELNETDAVAHLLSAYPCEAKMKIDAAKAKALYTEARNTLVHVLSVKRGNTSIAIKEEMPFEDAVSFITTSDKAVPILHQFTLESVKPNTHVYVDRLAYDIEGITKWLSNKVLNGDYSDERVQKAIGWLEDILG